MIRISRKEFDNIIEQINEVLDTGAFITAVVTFMIFAINIALTFLSYTLFKQTTVNNNNISMNNSKNAALVENIKASKNSYPQDNDNAVHFHTMHSCKGLEYKVVFIMDVVEGIIPYNKAVLDYEIEEERRLMYVAMTRAKEKLYLLYAKSRYNKDTTISRFVTEIDDHYVDYSFSESSCS